MESSFFYHIAMEKPRLFGAILRFNNKIVTYPKTRAMLDALPQPLADAFPADPLLLGKLRHNEDAGPFFWDFEEESSRIALLDAACLQKLFLFFGASVWGDEISHVIVKKDRDDLTEKIGAEAYLFALKRGRFLTGHLYPFFSSLQQEDSLENKILATQKNVFSVLYGRWPSELRTAVSSLFSDTDFFQPETERSADTVLFTSIWNAVKKILIREVDPQCAQCFD